VLDFGNGRVRRIDQEGIATTLLDTTAVDEDGIPLHEAGRLVGQLALGPAGDLYFCTSTLVFRRSREGRITRMIGSGKKGFSGDGGLATQAALNLPIGLAVDKNGTLYLGDFLNNRIRRVGLDGIIETIAGNGKRYSNIPACVAAEKPLLQSGNRCFAAIGDGGPAIEATIWWPEQLLLTQEGDLLVAMSRVALGLIDWGGGGFSQLRRICRVGESVPTVVEESVSVDLSDVDFPSLHIFPNPFNPEVTIAFRLERSARVSAVLYDVLGQQVRTLAASAQRPAGPYQFIWDGRNSAGRSLSSGTYFFKLSIDDVAETSKLTLLR